MPRPLPPPSSHSHDPFLVAPKHTTTSPFLPSTSTSSNKRPSSSTSASETPPSASAYSTPITPGRRTLRPNSPFHVGPSTSKSSSTPSNTINSSRKKSSSLSNDRPAAAKKPRLSTSSGARTTRPPPPPPPPFFPILTRAESVDPLEEEGFLDGDRDPIAMDDEDDAPLSYSAKKVASNWKSKRGTKFDAAALSEEEDIEVKEEKDEDDEEVRRATMIVDAVEIEGEGSDLEEDEDEGQEGNDDYQEGEEEDDEEDEEDDGGDVSVGASSTRTTRLSGRAGGRGGAILDEFVQGVATVVGGAATGTRSRKAQTSASAPAAPLPESSEEPEPESAPQEEPTSSTTARPKPLALAGTGSNSTSSASASSSRKKVSSGNGNGNGEEKGSSPSKNGEVGESDKGKKKSSGGASGSGTSGGGGSGGDKKRKEKENKEEKEEKEKEREEVERLGLGEVWDELVTDISSLLDTALESFEFRISARIRVAMAYPPVELDPSSPALSAFLNPYLRTLRPSLVTSLLSALPTIENRVVRQAANAKGSTPFQARDYQEFLFTPLHTLLTSTTETLQSAALDRVLSSFPSILGDEPRDELRELVEKRSVNVMKNVKEGVRLVLEKVG